MKVICEETLDLFRGLQKCGMCKLLRGCEPHHVWCKGMGGGGRLDVSFLLLPACRPCHQAIHDGKTTRAEILVMVSEREKMPVEEIERQLHLFRRAPRECSLCPRCGGRGGTCAVCLGSGVVKADGDAWIEQPKGGIGSIIGKWPGDETDEQIRDALEKLS